MKSDLITYGRVIQGHCPSTQTRGSCCSRKRGKSAYSADVKARGPIQFFFYITLATSSFCFLSCDRDTLSNQSQETQQPNTKVDPDELFEASRMEYGKDPVGAFHKLVLAADSGHFKAAQGVARSYWPKDNNFIKKYGRDEVDAKINILENAIRKNDKIYLMYKLETDLILAGLYNKDLSAAYDPVKARSIYRRLSEDKKVNAWSHYAKMSFDGAGGERDLAQAYFYYSAICKVFDFDSFDAERAWEMRNKIVEIIEPHVALSELDRLNIWLDDDSQRPYPYHTVYTQGNPETENAVKAQKEREEIHVKNLQKMIE